MHLHLVVSRLHGYYAEVPGLLPPDSFSNFISVFFFFLFRPTDPKSEHAFGNKRKKRMALSFEIKIKILFAVRVSRDMERITLKRRKNKQIRYESQANSVTNVLITPFPTVLHAMSDWYTRYQKCNLFVLYVIYWLTFLGSWRHLSCRFFNLNHSPPDKQLRKTVSFFI